ncbi:MAG: YigZ family protein [Cytophagaceae bacterium]|jgi:uncharacterized YigZ family protein|nr:YigZ family protein [Cytophagaceae bacterium]
MKTDDTYITIAMPAEGIYKEKGSKFFAFAFPVMDEDAIKEHVQKLKLKYYDARHHCFAWQLGVDGSHFRTNDDGEPSGTAGKPILGQIRSCNLTNLLIVVVRYFGGIKLGTGGLVNAYKSASVDAIANATIIERTVNDLYNISFAYGVMNDVMRIVKEESPEVTAQQFNIDCSMHLSIRSGQSFSLISRLEKIDTVKIEHLHRR